MFSAKGALLLLAWGIALGHLINPLKLSRAFSAGVSAFINPGALPQARGLNAAPLARNIRIFIAPDGSGSSLERETREYAVYDVSSGTD
jgi:hypothetical protein